jgi:hypothetical protein
MLKQVQHDSDGTGSGLDVTLRERLKQGQQDRGGRKIEK